LSFGVPNKQFFAPAEFFPERQLKYFRSEYLWSQVTMGQYLVKIIQYSETETDEDSGKADGALWRTWW
jgi:hypothetical protein